MAKPTGASKAKAAPPPDRPPPPAPPDAAAPAVTPKGIADDFKAAVAAVEQEQGVQLKPTARATTATPGAPAAPAAGGVIPPAVTWTPSGVGRAGVHLTNTLLAMGEFEELEPEEETGLAEDVAYYLSVRWPSGSEWEPELRLGARALEVIGPRIAARRKLQKEQALDKEAEDLHDQTDRPAEKPVPGGERKKAELVPVIPARPMEPPPVIPRKEDK